MRCTQACTTRPCPLDRPWFASRRSRGRVTLVLARARPPRHSLPRSRNDFSSQRAIKRTPSRTLPIEVAVNAVRPRELHGLVEGDIDQAGLLSRQRGVRGCRRLYHLSCSQIARTVLVVLYFSPAVGLVIGIASIRLALIGAGPMIILTRRLHAFCNHRLHSARYARIVDSKCF
jgi:hypothetical protein